MTFVPTIDGTLCKNVLNSMYILIAIFCMEKAVVSLGFVVTQKWFRVRQTTLEEEFYVQQEQGENLKSRYF